MEGAQLPAEAAPEDAPQGAAEASEPNLPEPSEELVEEGAPAWILTFGDLMSLLLTFFILLFSMSSVETEKFKAAAQSLQEAFGNPDGQPLPNQVPEMSDTIPIIISQTEQIVDEVLEEIRRQLQLFVSENQLQDKVVVAKEAEGVFLRIQDATVFLPGAAGIEDEGARVLARLGDITRLIEVPVVVTGHTDDSPINSGIFRSNWELSAVRAAGVARALVERGQNAALVTVEAYSQYRPVSPNDTPAGRALNRRVELYYSRQGVIKTLVERGLLPNAATAPAGVAGVTPSEAVEAASSAAGG